MKRKMMKRKINFELVRTRATAKQIMTWTPEGRKRRGRLRKSWREGIVEEIRDPCVS